MTAKLIITLGLPGSGKTYWADQEVASGKGKVIKVERDQLRDMLWDGRWSKEREKLTVTIRNEAILAGLQAGCTVVCSDTNLSPQVQAELVKLATGYPIEYKDFREIPLAICLKQNRERDRKVPEDVIKKMWADYIEPHSSSIVSKDTLELPHSTYTTKEYWLGWVRYC